MPPVPPATAGSTPPPAAPTSPPRQRRRRRRRRPADCSTGILRPLPHPAMHPPPTTRPRPRDCPATAAPLRPPLAGSGPLCAPRAHCWGRAPSHAPGIRAPIRPLCAAQIIGCGSGKVAAYESGGASGTRVSLPFPPPLDPPSHPLTFVRTHTRGEGRGKTHGGLLSCYRPPALRGAG